MDIELKNGELELKLKQSCDLLFNFFKQWRSGHEDMTEQEGIAQCILQMIITNSHCILKLSEGINIIPNNDKFSIIDPSSMISILRSLYEKVFIFHNVYVQPETDIERKILFNIWAIRGLKNRQGLENVPEKYKNKEKSEQESLEELKQETTELINNLIISPKAKKMMCKALSSETSMMSGFKITKDKDKMIISFDTIKLTSSPKELFGERLLPMYRFLSTHAHPSYIGILQYGQMFNTNEDKVFLKLILFDTLLLQIIFITDFCKSIRGAEEIWESISGVKEFLLDCSRIILQDDY